MGTISSSSPVLDAAGAPAPGRKIRVVTYPTSIPIGYTLTKSIGDASYSSVALLLDGNGLNGATTFIDRSSSPKTVSVTGSVTISTDRSKFRDSSIKFDGSASYLSSTSSALVITSGDYTVDFWLFMPSLPASLAGLFFNGTTSSNEQRAQLEITAAGAIRAYFQATSGTGASIVSADAAISAGVWHHIEYSVSGTSKRIFVDGVLVASGTYATSITASNDFYIGLTRSSSTLWYLSGYISDFRMTPLARHTAGFTPSIYAAPDYDNSVDNTGHYSIDTGSYTGQCSVTCLHDGSSPDYNDLHHRTTPV